MSRKTPEARSRVNILGSSRCFIASSVEQMGSLNPTRMNSVDPPGKAWSPYSTRLRKTSRRKKNHSKRELSVSPRRFYHRRSRTLKKQGPYHRRRRKCRALLHLRRPPRPAHFILLFPPTTRPTVVIARAARSRLCNLLCNAQLSVAGVMVGEPPPRAKSRATRKGPSDLCGSSQDSAR